MYEVPPVLPLAGPLAEALADGGRGATEAGQAAAQEDGGAAAHRTGALKGSRNVSSNVVSGQKSIC